MSRRRSAFDRPLYRPLVSDRASVKYAPIVAVGVLLVALAAFSVWLVRDVPLQERVLTESPSTIAFVVVVFAILIPVAVVASYFGFKVLE